MSRRRNCVEEADFGLQELKLCQGVENVSTRRNCFKGVQLCQMSNRRNLLKDMEMCQKGLFLSRRLKCERDIELCRRPRVVR